MRDATNLRAAACEMESASYSNIPARWCVTWVCCLGIWAGNWSPAAANEPLRFNRDIRPILANHCFACHGPDTQARRGGLRLDRRVQAIAPADSGEPAIVPNHPDQSRLVARIRSEDPDLQMPPPDANKPLSAEQKRLLDRWIEEGAEYEAHWSL